MRTTWYRKVNRCLGPADTYKTATLESERYLYLLLQIYTPGWKDAPKLGAILRAAYTKVKDFFVKFLDRPGALG